MNLSLCLINFWYLICFENKIAMLFSRFNLFALTIHSSANNKSLSKVNRRRISETTLFTIRTRIFDFDSKLSSWINLNSTYLILTTALLLILMLFMFLFSIWILLFSKIYMWQSWYCSFRYEMLIWSTRNQWL